MLQLKIKEKFTLFIVFIIIINTYNQNVKYAKETFLVKQIDTRNLNEELEKLF